MRSFLLSILEFLRDDCLDDVVDNGSDSGYDAFWFWLFFDDGLSDLMPLYRNVVHFPV